MIFSIGPTPSMALTYKNPLKSNIPSTHRGREYAHSLSLAGLLTDSPKSRIGFRS